MYQGSLSVLVKGPRLHQAVSADDRGRTGGLEKAAAGGRKVLTDKTKSFRSYDHKFEAATAGMGPNEKYFFWRHYLRAAIRRPGLTYAAFRAVYLNRHKSRAVA